MISLIIFVSYNYNNWVQYVYTSDSTDKKVKGLPIFKLHPKKVPLILVEAKTSSELKNRWRKIFSLLYSSSLISL